MIRYVYSYLLVVLIVGGIGFLYVQQAFLTTKLDFDLETIEGDEELMENVSLHGSHSNSREVPVSQEQFEVTHEGTVYSKPQYHNVVIDRLVEEYRSFMRGKMNPEALYEDENFLIYVAASGEGSEDYFAVSMLDKAADATEEIQIPAKNVQHLYIRDVQLMNTELKVVATSGNVQEERTEAEVYSLNLAAEELVSQETILSEAPKEGKNISLSPLQPMDIFSSDVIVFKISHFGENEHVEELAAYHYQTESVERIDMPVDVNENDILDYYSDGERILMLEREVNELFVHVLDLEADTVDEEELGIATDVEDYPLVNVSEELLYLFVPQNGENPTIVGELHVYNLDTSTPFYKGNVKVDEASQEDVEQLDFWFNYLSV